MIIIRPEQVNDGNLISSNVPEDDFPPFDAGANYNAGDKVIYEHRIYEALDNHTHHGVTPDQDPEHWLDLGATNRYRTFDQIVGNQTTNTGSIEFTVRMGAIIDGIAFFGLSAATVRVVVDDPVDGIVYDQTIELSDYSNIISYFTYQFEPVGDTRTEIAFLDLPAYAAADITVTIDAGAGIAACGEVVLGAQRVIGVTNFGTTIGLRDYSRKEVDQFGNFIVVKRRFAKLVDYAVTIETSDLARVQRFFSQIRSEPVVSIGDPDREETLAYGFYKDFSVPITTPSICDASIQFEGLT